jgi:hypothetical protein
MRLIAKKVEKAKVVPKPKIKKLKINLKVTATEKEGGKWVNAYHRIYKVVDGETEDSQFSSVSSRKKEEGTKKLEVGKYLLKSEYNDFKVTTPFEIRSGEVTKLNIVMGQTGEVEISATEKEGGRWINAYHRIYKVIDDEAEDRQFTAVSSFKKKSGKKRIPAGKYVVKSKYNDFKVTTPFEIKSGEVTKLNIVMGQTGEVEITATQKEGGRWIKAYHRIYKVIDGEADDSQFTAIGSYKKKSGKKRMPVGKYIVKSEHNKFQKITPFEIKSGKRTKLNIQFGQFYIESKCPNRNEKVSYEIYASSGQLLIEETKACDKKLNLTLDSGDYSVEAKIASGKKEVNFSLGSGRPNSLTIDLTNLNHEDEIEADSAEAVATDRDMEDPDSSEEINSTKQEEKIKKVVDVLKVLGGDIDEEDAKDLQQAGAMLEMLGSMMKGVEKKEIQPKDSTKDDKEFEEMSKDLDMYTK